MSTWTTTSVKTSQSKSTDEDFRLQLRFWGVRGSIPTPQHENLQYGGNTPCLEIRSSEHNVIVIDGGTGVRNLGLSLKPDGPDERLSVHLFLTHFHWDHIQGLPFFAPLWSPQNEVIFHAGTSPEDSRNVLEGQMTYPYFPVSFGLKEASRVFVDAMEQPFQLGPICVHAFPLHHPQGALGYRFECDGAVIVHASDCEHGNPVLDRVLREFAQDADVLIYDSQYTPEEYEQRKHGWGHSTWLEATRVARDAGVKQLILFHHDPNHDDVMIGRITECAQRHFEHTVAAREGSVVRL